ncbi:hypothetical protein JTB14_030864 [Gonioctena quinquepunctata]|nr:hypothetical protein JTB14_030864 [Gonioctena quinquepunctata]
MCVRDSEKLDQIQSHFDPTIFNSKYNEHNKYSVSLLTLPSYERVFNMKRPAGMALFGMVWLLRMRSEMKRCAKCRRECLRERQQQLELQRTPLSSATCFTIDTAAAMQSSETLVSPERSAPTTYCEVHGYNPAKKGMLMNVWPREVTYYSFVLIHSWGLDKCFNDNGNCALLGIKHRI